jgi:hypothetical protein
MTLFSSIYLRAKLAINRFNYEAPVDRTIDDFDPETFYFSNEVPTNKSFFAMGLCEDENEYLDANDQGDTFRQSCVQQQGANYFLHKKTLNDLRSIPEHHNPQILSEILLISYNMAYRLAEAFKALQIDRKSYLKMLKGSAGKRGLENVSPVAKLNAIEALISTAQECEDVTVHWNNYTSGDPDSKHPDHYQRHLENAEIFQDDDVFEDANPFGANRLFNGNEALSWELQRKIETASSDTLRCECKKMFAQKNCYGRFQRRVYYYFTQGMKSHFWSLYRARKAELAATA